MCVMTMARRACGERGQRHEREAGEQGREVTHGLVLE